MLSIILPPEQRRRLVVCLRRSGNREIGGILMGEQLTPGHFSLADFSLDEASGNAARFVCTPEHHQGALEAFFARTGADYRRFNYLGEWHSHPQFPVVPSAMDIASMEALVRGERDISFAMLMIVRLRYGIRLQALGLMFSRHQNPEPVKVHGERRWFR